MAAISVEDTEGVTGERQEQQEEITGGPIRAEEIVDTGSQHVLKVC